MLSYFSQGFSLSSEGSYRGVNNGFDKVRVVGPVAVGSRIRCHTTVTEIIQKKPGQYDFKMAIAVEIEGGDKPALVAEWLSVQMAK